MIDALKQYKLNTQPEHLIPWFLKLSLTNNRLKYFRTIGRSNCNIYQVDFYTGLRFDAMHRKKHICTKNSFFSSNSNSK